MQNVARFGLLLAQILIFSFIYMFLDDSHFSGINTLEEMIKTELLQSKIDPIIEKTAAADPTDSTTTVQENFEVYGIGVEAAKEEEEIEKITEKTAEIKKDIEEENLTQPSFFDRFFKRLYFSFVTGTTLGYGDIFPYSIVCKSVTIIQLIVTILLIIV